jgi:hypothetical protein
MVTPREKRESAVITSGLGVPRVIRDPGQFVMSRPHRLGQPGGSAGRFGGIRVGSALGYFFSTRNPMAR